MNMGDRIRNLRKQNNLTQEELAHKIGLQKSAIAKYENGRVENMKRSVIQDMADILGTTPAYLMGWEDLKQGSKIQEDDLAKIGSTPEKIKDDILNLKPFDNIVDAITFIKDYEVKFFMELDLSNKTVDDVVKLVNNILKSTQDTIKKERNR